MEEAVVACESITNENPPNDHQAQHRLKARIEECVASVHPYEEEVIREPVFTRQSITNENPPDAYQAQHRPKSRSDDGEVANTRVSFPVGDLEIRGEGILSTSMYPRQLYVHFMGGMRELGLRV